MDGSGRESSHNDVSYQHTEDPKSFDGSACSHKRFLFAIMLILFLLLLAFSWQLQIKEI